MLNLFNRITRKLCSAYRKKKYSKKLKNSDFSLIASNCMGGIIYHELGLQFLSPFVNLRIDSKDFIKLACNFNSYMEKELRFIERCDEGCPTAMLGDVTIYFVHYQTEEEAKQKWDERKKRINYDNLFFLTNDCDGVTHEDMLKFSQIKCRNKCLFTSKKYDDCKSNLYLSIDEGKEHVRYLLVKSNKTGRYDFEKYFDFTEWLNSNNIPAQNFRKY